jgi:hypothetical protein
MNKQISFLIVIIFLVASMAGVYIYWNIQTSKHITPTGVGNSVPEKTSDEITAELDKDMAELETVASNKDLETLDEDLAAVTEDETSSTEAVGTDNRKETEMTVDTSSLENLEEELGGELNDFAGDLSDLEQTATDNSLDNLDDSLANF